MECSLDSKKLNIAIILASSLQSGGGYQYEYMILKILKKYHLDSSIDLKFYAFNSEVKNNYNDIGLQIKVLSENIFQKIHRISLSNFYWYSFFSKLNLSFSFIENQFQKDKIDLVYFLSPSLISQGLNNIPYIFTLWDLGHLDLIEFPEVSYNRQFESRELVYTKSLKKAFKVVVDLDYGKRKVIEKYNLDYKRVEVLKFLPNIKLQSNNYKLDIKEKYSLKNDYIFYPAQFWAHKNHIYILKAIKLLREEKKIDIEVIFSGSDKGNLNYILNKAKQFEIDDLIHYVGFVDEEEIPKLYKQSIALVMPTYLGPTNIPPLEAFAYETTLCYSDTPFFREQVGDSAFYMDLKDPNSLVNHILSILKDKDLVKSKKEKGNQILQGWSEKDFYIKLLGIFNEYKYIRDLWD